jgi:putative protease
VVADYAVNAFNEHTAAELFALGARRVVASVELTVEEIAAGLAPVGRRRLRRARLRPARGDDDRALRALGGLRPRADHLPRPVRAEAHERRAHRPAGYTFRCATDSACRNRLLHSRPVEGSEYLPRLWRGGIRGFQLVFNVPGDRVGEVTASYRAALDAQAGGARVDVGAVRAVVGEFTRGHFARAV